MCSHWNTVKENVTGVHVDCIICDIIQVAVLDVHLYQTEIRYCGTNHITSITLHITVTYLFSYFVNVEKIIQIQVVNLYQIYILCFIRWSVFRLS
jgi:hypothetical protein